MKQLLSYLKNLSTGRLILWCYLIAFGKTSIANGTLAVAGTSANFGKIESLFSKFVLRL